MALVKKAANIPEIYHPAVSQDILDFHARVLAQQSLRTFWTFMREFSPLEVHRVASLRTVTGWQRLNSPIVRQARANLRSSRRVPVSSSNVCQVSWLSNWPSPVATHTLSMSSFGWPPSVPGEPPFSPSVTDAGWRCPSRSTSHPVSGREMPSAEDGCCTAPRRRRPAW